MKSLTKLIPWAVGILVAVLLLLNFVGVERVRAMFGGVGFAVNSSPTSRYENIALGKPYKVDPNPNYPGTAPPGGKQLTDGIYTPEAEFWKAKSTLGWDLKRLITITIDLGKVEPIRGVSYNTVAEGWWTTWPFAIYVLVSDDGQNYYYAGDLVTMSNAQPIREVGVHRFWTDDLKTHGRYVQLIVDTDGNNSFTDEVEVYRGDPVWTALPHQGQPTAGGVEYIKAWATDHGVRARLKLDIAEARETVAKAGLNVQAADPLLRELKELEAQIAELGYIEPERFRAVMPLNSLQARIFAVTGKVRQLQGSPGLQAWVGNPYDYLSPTQRPEKGASDRIDVWLMRGEWRSAVVNLTNSTAAPVSARVRIEGLPGGVNPSFIRVYQVEWTATREHKPIAAALIEAKRDRDAYIVDIPAGMVRQLWLSFRPQNMTPGNYAGRVAIAPAGGQAMAVPLGMQLFPMTFPKTPTLHVSGLDFTDGIKYFGVNDTNRKLLVEHLQERFVDSTWAQIAVFELGAFHSDGTMGVSSTKRFDDWVKLWPQARRYFIMGMSEETFAGYKVGSDEFNARVKSWINFWVSHAAKKGIKPEQIFLCPVDEAHTRQQDRMIVAWAKAIHAAQPKVSIWVNPIYIKPQRDGLPEMFAFADVLTPQRLSLIDGGKDAVDFYIHQRESGRRLELYSASGPMLLLDPYSYVRLQAWSAWSIGAEASSFWSFADRGGEEGSPWQPYTSVRRNHSPVFMDAVSVTAGKHMEAIRESVEDYEYLVMLRDALAANPGKPGAARAQELLSAGPQRVLNADGAENRFWPEQKDRWEADRVRLEVLKAIANLR